MIALVIRATPLAALFATFLCAGVLGACGKETTVGQTDGPPAQEGPADSQTVPRGGVAGLPSGVPTQADPGAEAPATDRRIINAWARALREGDVRRAAGYFADPSRIQNGTPVITLRDERERVVFNASLPCGSRAAGFGFRDGFVIVEVVLTERVGGDCGGAAGARARVAIRVQDRRITDWYRLADDPDATPDEQAPPELMPLDPALVDTV